MACSLLIAACGTLTVPAPDQQQPVQVLSALQTRGGNAVCHQLTNFMNTQYTARISVGTPGQTITVVPDTGSRELIISSTKCGFDCPNKNKYNAASSSSWKAQQKDIETVFGQGTVVSEVSRDVVEIVDSNDQSLKVAAENDILEMKRQQIKNFARSAFDGVMGLGKQSEARKDDSSPALLTSMGVEEFSMCFGRAENTPGILMFNSAPALPAYTELNVVGDNHWAVKMSGVGVGSDEMKLCADGCGAILDTGTSLIAGPSEALDKLAQQLPDVSEDCSNLHSLPSIKFKLDGKEFLLPPTTWVLKVESEESQTHWFGPFKMKSKNGAKRTVCVPAFMEMNMKSQFGPVWILGMPFLREYAAKFDRPNKKLHLAQTGQNTCSSCAAATGRAAGGASLVSDESILNEEPLTIDPQAVLMPWIHPDLGNLDLSATNGSVPYIAM